MSDQTAPPLPRTYRPCPAWCSLDSGHPFDLLVAGDASRFHVHRIGQVPALGRPAIHIAVEISSEENVATVPGYVTDAWGDATFDLIGPSRYSPPVLEVCAEDASLGDAAAALQLAELVREGARILATLEQSC